MQGEFDYYASRSGLTPPAKFSLADHQQVVWAGKTEHDFYASALGHNGAFDDLALEYWRGQSGLTSGSVGDAQHAAFSNTTPVIPSGAVIYDDFSGSGTPATALTGQSYTVLDTGTGAAFSKSNGKVGPSAGSANAYLMADAGKQNAVITVRLGDVPLFIGGVALLGVDASNLVFLGLRQSATAGHNHYILFKRVAGTETGIAAETSVTPAPGDLIKITVTGTAADRHMVANVNGVDITSGDVTDSGVTNGTLFGVRGNFSAGAGVTYDSLEVD